MINKDRLVEEFIKLVSIDSPSRSEGKVASYLKGIAEAMEGEIFEDNAHESTGGDSGNLLIRIKGNDPKARALFLNSHIDTVSPGINIKPHIKDGVIYSDGTTILGSDDKSGVAIILEVVRSLREANLPYGDLEILFTVCEEVGLLGAKHFDTSLLKSTFGYSLDSTESGSLIYAAPAANHIELLIKGCEAHAGLAPEKGISAIQLAGKALAQMKLGRIDDETTANIGIIGGGTATNIVPGLVKMEGEARSHDTEKLKKQTEEMLASVRDVVEKHNRDFPGDTPAEYDIKVSLDYPSMHLDRKGMAISLAEKAARNMGQDMPLIVGGGGSDANIWNDKGVEVGILGTGMDKVHTNDECIKISDMVKTCEFLLRIIVENSSGSSC